MGLEAFAILPLWIRLVGLYLLIGWLWDAYASRTAAGSSVAAAIGGALLAGIVGPVKDVEARKPWLVPEAFAMAQIAYHVPLASEPASSALTAPLVPKLMLPLIASVWNWLLPLVASVTKSAVAVALEVPVTLMERFLNAAVGGNCGALNVNGMAVEVEVELKPAAWLVEVEVVLRSRPVPIVMDCGTQFWPWTLPKRESSATF